MSVSSPDKLLGQLLPHQRAIVDAYSAEISTVYLDAPPGTGKTITAVALAMQEVKQNPYARILVIAPARSLVAQYVDRLKAAGLRTKLIDRYAYRALVDESRSAAIWSEGTAFGITSALVRQHDVATALLGTQWDLVIADEMRGPDTVSWVFLQQLLGASKKALVIFAADSAQSTAGAGTMVVKWDLQEMVDQAGRSLAPPPPFFKTINFKADQHLERTASELRHAKMPNLFADAAASSPAALERAVQSYMARGSVEDEEQNAIEGPSASEGLEPEARAALVSASKALEELTEDQKAAALVSLLKQIIDDSPHGRICVITKFVSTAYYLSAVLEAEGIAGIIATASAPENRENLSSFIHSPRPIVLIATRSAVMSEPLLRRVTDLIFYEAPKMAPQAERIIGHANAIGRRDELRIYEMTPA